MAPWLIGIGTWIALFFIWPRLMLTIAILSISAWLLTIFGYLK